MTICIKIKLMFDSWKHIAYHDTDKLMLWETTKDIASYTKSFNIVMSLSVWWLEKPYG